MFFLSSIPRSGSTLLASLLNQRPDTYASQTSNLCDMMGAAIRERDSNPATQASGGDKSDLIRTLRGMIASQYDTDKMVFDKSRGWAAPGTITTMRLVQGDVRIVATVRPIAECVASFVKIAKPDDIKEFCKGHLVAHLVSSYRSLQAAYEQFPEAFLLIEYDALVSDTQAQMDRIADFVSIERFKHDRRAVPDSGEEDKAWGIKDLHKVRRRVSRRDYSAKDTLGDELFNLYQGHEFWNDKPEPTRGGDPLDLQLEASLRGNFKKAGQITRKLLRDRPDCNRVKFNAGWHSLHDGKLSEGHRYLDAGRLEDVFGSKCPSSQPRWEGEPGTVLLFLEGGLGDQMHGFRFAADIQARGNMVAVSSSAELAPMFAEQFITVQHEAAPGTYHDFYVPSMSAVLPLGYEYDTLRGGPYIERTADTIPGRIGVRWAGNPKFEHEQHRLFPVDLLFDAVQGHDCMSLQRDHRAEDKPTWMKQAALHDWAATRRAISTCELVITSCTSTAHLAGAMGVPTWIIVPILPYYLWALPGDRTPYYDSVRLFRQTKYGDWAVPFDAIKSALSSGEELKCMHM